MTLMGSPQQSFPGSEAPHCVLLFSLSWAAACQASLSITNAQSLLKLMSIESVIPSNHLILCRPLLLPSIFPATRSFPMSQLFASGAKVSSFSFSVSPSIAHSGLISFRMDRLDLLAVLSMLAVFSLPAPTRDFHSLC